METDNVKRPQPQEHSETYLKSGDAAQLVECLYTLHEVLGPSPSVNKQGVTCLSPHHSGSGGRKVQLSSAT